MNLNNICEKIATSELGKKGSIVECMVGSACGERFGAIGERYMVRGLFDGLLSLEINNKSRFVIANRFRHVSTKEGL